MISHWELKVKPTSLWPAMGHKWETASPSLVPTSECSGICTFIVHGQERGQDRTGGMYLQVPSEGAAVSPTVTGTSGLSLLGLCLAVPRETVRWCTISSHEASKCSDFRDSMQKLHPETGPLVGCVKKTSHTECIKAIAVSHRCLKESGRQSLLSLVPVRLESVLTHRRLMCGAVDPHC